MHSRFVDRDGMKFRIEWLRERTEHLDIYLFFRPSLSGDLFQVFCRWKVNVRFCCFEIVIIFKNQTDSIILLY